MRLEPADGRRDAVVNSRLEAEADIPSAEAEADIPPAEADSPLEAVDSPLEAADTHPV